MRTRWLLSIIATLAASSAVPAALIGQATDDQGPTGDQARLVFTVSAGFVGDKKLWSTSPQPVQFITPADTFALDRRIRSTLAIGFGGAYFPGENLGFTAEGFLVGLGFEDSCRHLFSSGSADVAAACRSIQRTSNLATAVILSGGTIFRVMSRKVLSPYARANVGVVFGNQSPLRIAGQYPAAVAPGELVVYGDDRNSRVEPALALGIGVTAAVARGYQIRWEVRDNIVGVQRVTGPLAQSGSIPPHSRVFKHLFSMTLGFDVVLERRRGRRY
jgi:hypothetical protein